MTEALIRDAIAGERGELAGLLAGLPESTWDAPTLCTGWRVWEVVAHMTMAFRYSVWQFVGGMVRARGNVDRMADRSATRDTAALSAAELAACLRENTRHPWKPPGGGFAGALSHDVIHGLDITVALGLDRRVPEDRMRIVLDSINPRSLKYFGVDLTGIQLRADDLDWTFGSGTPLSGSAQDLLLVLSGRILPRGHLQGEPSAGFTG